MKFEVHDKQYFQVWLWKQPSQAKILQIYSGKSGQNGAAGNNFTIFIQAGQENFEILASYNLELYRALVCGLYLIFRWRILYRVLAWTAANTPLL